ncbi:hypothetical protein QZH41_002190 [Actinostola sp. cb2023]|nr:hypothetical protein QZH41_002190 [Actinostola sp. cb2023]
MKSKTLCLATKDHIPQKKISGRWDLPYLSRELKRKIRKKCRRYKKAKSSGKAEDWKNFKDLRRTIKKDLQLAHDSYIKEILNTSTLYEKPKRFWSYIKGLKKDKTGVSQLKYNGLSATDSKSKAEFLSNQYQQVFTKEDLNTLPNLPTSNIPVMEDIVITTAGPYISYSLA